MGLLDEAEREVMTAFAIFGRGCGEALFLLGTIRALQKKLDEALQLMTEAVVALPLDAGVRYGYGSALLLAGQPEPRNFKRLCAFSLAWWKPGMLWAANRCD